jgi:hypothetical protein
VNLIYIAGHVSEKQTNIFLSHLAEVNLLLRLKSIPDGPIEVVTLKDGYSFPAVRDKPKTFLLAS